MNKLELIQEIKNAHIEIIWCVKFHPFYNIFASSGNDRKIIIWEFNKNSNLYEKKSILSESHNKTIRSLCWDYSGKYLAAGSFDKKITIWKFKNNIQPFLFECITSLEGHESEIKNISFSISGKYLASCSRDKTIYIWYIENENEEVDFGCSSVLLDAHEQDIKCVKFSPREDVLFSSSFDDCIKIWKYDEVNDDFVNINKLKEHKGTVWYIDFNKDGNKFISCSDDKCIFLWNIDFTTKEPYKNLTILYKIENCHKRCIYSSKFTFDEKYILSSSQDNSIGLYELNEEKNKIIYKENLNNAHKYDVNYIECNSSSNLILSCSDDSSIKIWKIKEN